MPAISVSTRGNGLTRQRESTASTPPSFLIGPPTFRSRWCHDLRTVQKGKTGIRVSRGEDVSVMPYEIDGGSKGAAKHGTNGTTVTGSRRHDGKSDIRNRNQTVWWV